MVKVETENDVAKTTLDGSALLVLGEIGSAVKAFCKWGTESNGSSYREEAAKVLGAITAYVLEYDDEG